MKTHVVLALYIFLTILLDSPFAHALVSPSPTPSSNSRSVLITSPQTCLADLECGTGRHCVHVTLNNSFTCREQHDFGETCNVADAEECKDGLYCSLADADSSGVSTCKREVGTGGKCNRGECADGAVCRKSDGRCAPPGTGVAGDPCDSEPDCLQNSGYYCDSDASQCKRKEQTGGMCSIATSNFKCTGFCVPSSTKMFEGTCASTQPAGARCREDRHCNNKIFPVVRTSRLLCNVPRGEEGICMRETDLLRYLGQRCNPKADACDARRGLSCRWAPTLRRYACQQRADEEDGAVVRHCTPGSPLSVCNIFGGERQVCRLDPENAPFGRAYNGFFGCLPPVLVLPPGRVCNFNSNVACEPGYTCARVSGVRTPSSFNPPPEPLFCVRLGLRGAQCGSFSNRCASGLTCVTGRCIPGSDPIETPPGNWTHASFRADCSTLPCVPGAVCEKNAETDIRECALPTKVMRLGQPCRDTPLERRKCAAGLTCARDPDGRGLYSCRQPASLGAACDGDDPCVDKLKCSLGSSLPRIIGRCYDPALAIPLGDKCDPNARVGERQCSVEGDSGRVTSCLPKAGAFACQYPAALFEQCDPRINISCVGENVCGSIGVCLPPVS